MINKKKSYLKLGLVTFIIISILLILRYNPKIDREAPRNFDEIQKEGVLKVTCEYSNSSFHLEGDSLVGFYYEVAKEFAKSRHLKIEVIPENSYPKQKKLLETGKCDLIITGILFTTESKDPSISYTAPILLDKQVLVQRKNTNGKDSNYINSQLQLGKKTLYISEYSTVYDRIQNLMQEIGDTIYIKKIKKYNSEQLMAMVAHKNINFAVCSKNTVQAAIKYYPQLDTRTDISFNQFYSWGVNKKQKILLKNLNQWIEIFKKTNYYNQLINKYYK